MLSSGTRYFVRLFTKLKNGAWRSVDYSFVTGAGRSHLSSPLPGSQFEATTVRFDWSETQQPSATYDIQVTDDRSGEMIDHAESLLSAEYEVRQLVRNGRYQVTLTTRQSGREMSRLSRFTVKERATLTSPLNDAIDFPLNGQLQWSAVKGGRHYVEVGTAPGGNNILDSAVLQQTAIGVPGLRYATTYYVRLWTESDARWDYVDAKFTTVTDPGPGSGTGNPQDFYALVREQTGRVRMMWNHSTNQAEPGSRLAEQLQMEGSRFPSCSDFALVLVEELFLRGVAARTRAMTLTGTSFESHTTVEFYDPFLNMWSIAEPSFGGLYTDVTSTALLSADEIQARLLANQTATIAFQPATPYGELFLHGYYLDPMLLYLNVYAPYMPDSAFFGVTEHAPDSFMQARSNSEIEGLAGIYLWKFQDAGDRIVITDGEGQRSIGPANGTLFSGAVGLSAEWHFDGPAQGEPFVFKRLRF
jgi:hypothetical protein